MCQMACLTCIGFPIEITNNRMFENIHTVTDVTNMVARREATYIDSEDVLVNVMCRETFQAR